MVAQCRAIEFRRHLVLLAALTLAGCANPFSQYYTRTMNDHTASQMNFHQGEVRLFRGNEREADRQVLEKDGYYLIGYSSFNAANVSGEQAKEQARLIGAETALVYAKFRNTITGIMPLTVPNIQTTYHSGTVIGSGITASYSGTSTTSGTTTTYVPYSVDRYDYLATYWIKRKKGGLGINVRDLTSEVSRELGTNSGVVITAVVKGTSAFKQDIVPGDVITEVDGERTTDYQHLTTQLRGKEGRNVTFVINRHGTLLTKILYYEPRE